MNISEPYLVYEISEELENGTSLDEIIKYVETIHLSYKFSQTTEMHESCIMAWFEPR